MKVETAPTENSLRTAGPRRSVGLSFFVAMVLAIGAIAWFVHKGINQRVSAEAALVKETHEDSAIVVSVVHPRLTTNAGRLDLPGNTQPLIDAPIYARTSGYLKTWSVDIGTRVQKGDLLAEIEAPEVDQQLQQARADLQTAQTNLALAQTTADRMVNLMQKGAVARQDTDNVVADMNAKKTMVASAQANVKRLEDLEGFQKIYAPFDGVITARNTDIGQLIDAGASGASKELFHISATNKLRVFINVPEEYEREARTGEAATLTLNEFPGRTFKGTIVRNSNAIDPVSRTLLVEVDVDNPSGELLPGAYVYVHLKLPGLTATSLTVPVNTLLFRSEGLRAAVVRDGRAELVPVQVGRDFGDSLEVVHGLGPSDNLIVNPPDALVGGTAVRVSDQPQS